ncbi:MAG: YggT family protein [Bdellovibrionales bacterium]
MAVIASLFVALVYILGVVLNLYVWVIIISAVLSWLVAFDVVNPRNRLVHTIGDICFRLTEPALRPIRRFLRPFNGLDLSPVVLILAIMFLQFFLGQLIIRL